MGGGGGKGGTSTSTVSIPPEVLARYNSVNARAEEVAKQPFQSYGGEFVAPLTQTQQQGIQQTQDYSQAAQPYYQTAAGMTGAAAQAVQPYYGAATGITGAALAGAQPNYQQAFGMTTGAANAAQPLYGAAELQTLRAGQPLSPQQIQQYQNPFVQSVVDPTLQALRQQQGIDLTRQQAQQIQSGAYGGDRAGLSRAMLQGQQGLAQAQAISPLYQSAYQNALQAAQQQQQVGLTGAQQLGSLAGQQLQGQLGAGQQLGALTGQQYTNALAGAQQLAGIGGQQLQGQLTSAQQLAGIGTGAQQAGLQGAQAVIGAGTLGQQTKQAQDTAQYQQFLQQRGYDFQTAQFLANIAEGTGALSGSTTTTTQPTSFFSDERLKHDIKKIGKTNDGQPIYSFKYNGDDRTQIGLLAQEVEKKHPEAVGLSGGYKTVDYAKATAGARHARAMGGLVPESMGGAVFEPGNFARGGYVGGGLVTDPNDIAAILAAQSKSFGPFAKGGLYGGSSQQDPHGAAPGYVPKASLVVPKLVTSSFQPKSQQNELQSAMQNINAAGTAAKTLGAGYDWAENKYDKLTAKPKTDPSATSDSNVANPAGKTGADIKPPANQNQMNPSGAKTTGFGTDEVIDPNLDPTAFAPTVAHGGGIMPRHHFADGGPEDSLQDDFTTPGLVKEDKVDGKENRANVPASGFPTDVLSSGQSAKELAVAKNPSTSGGQSGMSSLAQGLGAANNALKAGKSISTMLGGGADAIGGGGTFAAGMGPFMSEAGVGAAGAGAAEGAGILGGLGSAIGSIGQAAMAILPFFGLSDARLKDNIKQVGKTFDGQNIYSYDMGDGRTQMGLLAQEVLHHKPEAVGEKQGYLTVDYRKATEDSAPHRAAGGLVPRQGFGGNDPGGAVEDPLAGYHPRDLAIRTIATEAPPDNAEEMAGVTAVVGNRLNSGQWGNDYKSVVTAKNQFEPWNDPNSPNYPLRVDPESDRYKKAAAALARWESEGYDPTGGAMHFWAPKAQTALGRQAPSWDNENALNIGATRFVKVGDTGAPKQQAPQQQQQSYPLQDQIEGGFGKAKSIVNSMVPSDYKGRDVNAQGEQRGWGDFLTSRDFVLPLMAGLGTMASSPSRYLGSAILQGLGGAASAYQGVQKGQMDRDTAIASQVAGLKDLGPLVTQVDKGTVEAAPLTSVLSPGLKKQFAPGTEVGGAATPGGGTSATYRVAPITVDPSNDRYMYNVAPTGDSIKNTARLLGVTNLNPITVKTALQIGNNATANADEAQRVESELAKSSPAQIAETRGIVNKALTTLTALPPDPKNPLSRETTAAAQLYNWLGAKIGLESVNEKEINAQALMDKISALNPTLFGSGGGSHAGYIVQEMKDALQLSKTPDEALRKIFSSVISGNQVKADFNRYVPEYRNAVGGASINLMNSFSQDMGQKPLVEQKAMEDAMKPRYPKDENGRYLLDAKGQRVRQDSPLEILLKSPGDPRVAKEFDKLYGQPGLARHFVGG